MIYGSFRTFKGRVIHGAQATLVGLNITFTQKLQKRLETEVAELDTYLVSVESSLDAEGGGLTTDRLVQPKKLEKILKVSSYRILMIPFADEKSPCPKGGDGKGGCMKMQPMMNQVIGGLNGWTCGANLKRRGKVRRLFS